MLPPKHYLLDSRPEEGSMSSAKVPFSKVAMLSLALSISTSCAQIAAATPQVVEIIKPGSASKHELEQKAKLRKSIKSAMASLRQMHKAMEESLPHPLRRSRDPEACA